MELKNKCEAIERREAERRAVDERKRKEEIDFLKPLALTVGAKSFLLGSFCGRSFLKITQASAAALGIFPQEPRLEVRRV